jgi:hypothetical protein
MRVAGEGSKYDTVHVGRNGLTGVKVVEVERQEERAGKVIDAE